MTAKPPYEELERRVLELEKIESDHKYSKEALQEKDSLFKMLYEKAPLGYQSLDENGHFIVVNQTWLETLGYTKEEVIGKSFADFLHPGWRDHFKENFPRFKSIGEVLGVEFEMVKKNGNLILVSFTGKISRDKKGNFQQTHCIFHDITDRKKHEELLEKYKNIISSTTDAIAYLDENYRYIIVNKAYEDFSGTKWDDLIGMTVPEYLGNDVFEEKIKSNMVRSLNGEIVNYQEWFEYPTKGKRFVDVTYFPYRDGENHVSGIIASTRDITEQKQDEDALKSNYAMLQIAGETAFFGGWSVDLEKNICTWSNAVADIHDVPHGHAPPVQEAINFYAPEWRERIAQCFGACAKEGIPYDEEMEIISQKGKRVWVRTIGNAVKNETGKIIKVQGSFQDITAHKRTVEDLRKDRERMDQILRATQTNINTIDSEYNLREVDASWQKIYGDPQGRKCHQYFMGLDKPCTGCGVPQALATREIIVTEQFLHKENRHIEVHTIPFQDENGEWLVTEFNVDITERKRSEAEREKLQIQLNQAQKMESVGRLAGGVAHDFNNMLGVILGHTELALLKVEENNDLISDLNEIQKAAKRSADITKQLLAFARKEIISPKRLDLNDTVESMLNILRRLIGEDIDLLWKPGAHLWPVKMDPSQIDQVLANLCVNARDAIDGVGKLTIKTGRKTFDEEYCKEHAGFVPGDFVLLSVKDNGCGMDKGTLDNLFEPFFTTKDVGKGTGLGLATIYGIVKQNNGFINVYSEAGQGSTFRVYLPRLVADEDTDKAVPKKKAAAVGSETILLVEDEPTILRMTQMMLERKGYTVIPAATPAEAMKKAKNHPGIIHLLMTDVVMPEMNGRNLAEQIFLLYPEIRLLFMSGYTSNVIVHHGVLDEGVAFIQKPFSMAQMTAKVREVLDIDPDKNQC
jgi:two-component system, cell cycle sensor histidine kinase and response regulator CckA